MSLNLRPSQGMVRSPLLKLSLLSALLLSALAFSNTGCEDKAIGRPCDTLATNEEDSSLFITQALECPSRVCLKPAYDTSAEGPRDTGPYCSAECSQDSDCEGQTRSSRDGTDFRCVRGFSCGIMTEIGPIRCKKLCLCRDFFKAGTIATPAACR